MTDDELGFFIPAELVDLIRSAPPLFGIGEGGNFWVDHERDAALGEISDTILSRLEPDLDPGA